MSDSPVIPISDSQPFVTITTPNIERANRLLSLRAHPGFNDFVRLSQELVQEAADICADYPGWDAQQITVLKVRMQTAKEHHRQLLTRINTAIEAGIQELREQSSSLPVKSAEEAVDQGDFVRQKMLEQFEEQDSRVAGSH